MKFLLIVAAFLGTCLAAGESVLGLMSLMESAKYQTDDNLASPHLPEIDGLMANSTSCEGDLALLFALKYRKNSLAMLDYSGKTYNDAGKWDSCRYLPPSAGAHYCLAEISAPSINQVGYIGLCFPESCTSSILTMGSTLAIKYLELKTGIKENLSAKVDCESATTKWDAKAILCFVIIMILVTLCFMATVMDICLQRAKRSQEERERERASLSVQDTSGGYVPLREDDEKLISGANGASAAGGGQPARKRAPRVPFIIGFLNCFRVNHNIQRIVVQTPIPNLTALNGLRGCAILGIILGHTHLYLLNVGVQNPYYCLYRFTPRWAVAGMTGNELWVDVFFFLSGFLVAYGALGELQKRGRINWGLYYFHRVWRLTPSLALVLFVYVALSPFVGQGPNWKRYQESLGFPGTTPTNPCPKYWWTNLVYVNNFWPVHFENQCFKWGWYLANDTQFYIISPIFLMAYHKNKRLGWIITTSVMIGCLALRFVLIRAFDISINSGHTDAYMDKLYGKPYARLPSYLVGFVVAFTYLQVGPNYKMPKWMLYTGSTIAFITAVSCWYGKYDFQQHPPAFHWSRTRNDLFLTFSRFGAASSMAWFMFISFLGDGGIIRSVLGAGFWAPIGRLTYNTYLIHPALISILLFSASNFYQYSPLLATYLYVTHVVLSFGFALVLYCLIEKPMMSLESILFHGKAKE